MRLFVKRGTRAYRDVILISLLGTWHLLSMMWKDKKSFHPNDTMETNIILKIR